MTNSVVVGPNPEPKASAPPECKGVPLFEPGDGDMQISVNGTYFETHKYIIKRFRGLRLLLEKQQLEGKTLEIKIQRDDISAKDFCETFKVLYTSVIAAPFVFSSRTLVSALRVATIYEYYALREYCIQYLDTLELGAIKRIEIAREFQLLTWEEQAYHELGMRDEPITVAEAKIIGLNAFVRIAEIREKEQRRKGREVDALDRGQNVQDDNLGDKFQRVVPHAVPTCTQISPHDDKPGTDDTTTYVDKNEPETGLSFAEIEPSGIYDSKAECGCHVEIPDCKCRFIKNGKTQDRKCAILPCTISLFKKIQAQQRAQSNRISDLESSVKNLRILVGAKLIHGSSNVQSTALKLVPELSPAVRPIHRIRPAGLLMPAFPKLHGWGQ
ncbi:hypothetical protein OPQ81_010284 [Rhizoctonia solani]|nr:hypothetical protein OPQ81_010284 [Rhizoctonia solani]